jgi:hypothetical protein
MRGGASGQQALHVSVSLDGARGDEHLRAFVAPMVEQGIRKAVRISNMTVTRSAEEHRRTVG